MQRQFDGLLMIGIVMRETCWAVSVRQGNKFYDWLMHVVGCFIWGSQKSAAVPDGHSMWAVWAFVFSSDDGNTETTFQKLHVQIFLFVRRC
jgi:hypothetical protein